MWDRLSSFARSLLGPKDPRRAFAAEVKRRLHAVTEQRVLREDEAAFSFEIGHPGGKTSVMYLGNLYDETRDVSDEERRARVDHFLSALAAAVDDEAWPEARELVLPVIRGTAFGAATGGKMLKRPLLPFLDVYFALDRPTSTSFIPATKLADWGIDEDTFFGAVDDRLAALDAPHVELLEGTGGVVHVVQAEDGHPPTRLLQPKFLRGFARRVEGRPLACLPTRDVVFITGADDPAGMRFVQEEAKKLWEESPRRISPAFYAVDENDKLVAYVPPGDDVLAQDARLLHLLLADFEYGESKQRFEASADPANQEVFMASYQAFRGEDGSSTSRATWHRDVPTWLPETDKVLLCSADAGAPPDWAIEVPFARLRARLTPVHGSEPPRFAVPATFPSKEEALALGGELLERRAPTPSHE